MKWPRKIEMSIWCEEGVCEIRPTDDDWCSVLREYSVTVAGVSLSEIVLDIDDAIEMFERISDEIVDVDESRALLEEEEHMLFNADPVLVVREYVLHVEDMAPEDEDPEDEDPEEEYAEDEYAEDEHVKDIYIAD